MTLKEIIMTGKINFNITFILLFFSIFFYFLLWIPPTYAANYPLEIINIKPAGTGNPPIPSTNRIFRAYPGIDYNIRPAVVGGLYPYTYSLDRAPSGMKINRKTGEINWSNPTANSGPIKLSVTDTEKTKIFTTWEIKVTKEGFWFVDSSYSGRSTGSASQPFKTLLEMLKSTGFNNQNDIVYFRSGNYNFVEFGPDEGKVFLGGYDKWYRPNTWIGYPNEIININGKNLCLQSHYIWLDNLNLNNFTDCAIYLDGGTHYKTIRRTTFNTLRSSTSTNNNQGFIKTFKAFPKTGYGLTIQDNSFTDFVGGQAIGSLYSGEKTLIENNHTFDGGYAGPHGFCTPIGIKAQNIYYTIRGNKIIIPANAANFDMYNQLVDKDHAEFLYNFIYKESGTALKFFYPSYFYMYRNTFIGDIEFEPSLSNGPYYFFNNVLIGSLVNAKFVIKKDNLIRKFKKPVVGNNGVLTPAYKSYLGFMGWQFPDGSTPMN